MLTGERTFISRRLFKDWNLVMGFLVMFVVGMVLLATTALLAPWLQLLSNDPVETAGLLLAPRGIGTMVAMMISGRLSNKMDARIVMAFGVCLLSWSLWHLSSMDPGDRRMVADPRHDGARRRDRLRVHSIERRGLRDAGAGIAL